MENIVSVEWLFNNLDNPNLVILDASPASNKSNLIPEFTSIKIKNARIFNTESVFVDVNNKVPNMFPSEEVFSEECKKLGINNNSIIVVYDNLGIYMSPRVWWMFKAMGHNNIAVLDGGLSAWKNSNYPCETYKETITTKGNFTALYNSDYVKDVSFMVKNINTKESLVLDARSNGRFTGELPDPRENVQNGHIPNAINLAYKNVLENGKMKSKEALKTVFSELNIGNENLTFSCGSGVTACIILLASELVLENEKSLYDGSWSEWGLESKYPVE